MKIKYSKIKAIFNFFNHEDFGDGLTVPRFHINQDSEVFAVTWIPNLPNRQTDLVISTSWVRSREDLVSTILHEMIHIWQYEYGAEDTHGWTFREWKDRFELKYGVIV